MAERDTNTITVAHEISVNVTVEFPADSEPNEEEVLEAIESALEDAELTEVEVTDEGGDTITGVVDLWRIN